MPCGLKGGPPSLQKKASSVGSVVLLQNLDTARGSGTASISNISEVDEKLVTVAVAFNRYRVEQKNREAVVGEGLKLKVASSDRRLVASPDDWRLGFSLPPATVHDLSYFNSFLPQGAKIHLVGGTGTVSANLQASAKNHQDDSGNVNIEAKGVEIKYEENHFRGDAEAAIKLKLTDINRTQFDAEGTTINLKNVISMTKTDKQSVWWGTVSLGKSLLTLQDPVRFNGQISLAGKDLRPLIGFFDVGKSLPNWIEKAVSFEGLKATAFFDADETHFKLAKAEVRSEQVNIDGWFQKDQHTRTGAFLMNYGVLTLGLRLEGKDVEFKVINPKEWYRKQNP